MVRREPIRKWVNGFGRHFSDCIRCDRPAAVDKWHLDEVVIPINGRKHWLWRAVDANGDVLDGLVQPQRNAKAATRFLARLTNRSGEPRVVITDKLRSYYKLIRDLAPSADHCAHKGFNTRIKGSHRPTRKRETLMGRFQPDRHKDFLRYMIRSASFFADTALNFPLSRIATRGPMLSSSGGAMPPI